MRRNLIIAGPRLDALMDLALQLVGTATPTVLEAARPVDALLSRPAHAEAAVVYLEGGENVADLRALFASHDGTRFLLLAPSFPPHAAVARVVAEHGGAVLPDGESSVVIAATLVALLTPADRAVAL
jgi:hypothetical protein